MILAQLTEATSFVDHAASSSDRWLFLAALALIISFGALAIRWLVTSLETKDKGYALERENKDKAHGLEREKLIAEIRAEHLECRAARKEDQNAFLHALELKEEGLRANTKAIEALASVITRHDTDVRTELAKRSPAA